MRIFGDESRNPFVRVTTMCQHGWRRVLRIREAQSKRHSQRRF